LTLLKPTIPEGVEVDEEKLMKELEAKDPLEERLKPISKDKLEDERAWALKVIGDTNEYRAMSKNKDTVNYGYIALKSLVWKGWTLVYHNKQWSSIYIGQGNKTSSQWYYPKEPEVVLEQPEPNFPPEEPKPKAPE
jgi:radial spoke head protein 4A